MLGPAVPWGKVKDEMGVGWGGEAWLWTTG